MKEFVFTALFILLFINFGSGMLSIDDEVTEAERKRLTRLLLYFNFGYIALTTLMVFAFN